ncbi:MAG TPA: AraC family transcriptional regulator, partial [bacterium]
DEHFTEPLRLENLAEKMGCSVPSFLQVFRRKTGMGFSQYLQEIRIKEAKRMLRAGSLTITLVAQECGFNSVSYFIQAFRRSTGLSPKQYRDSVKDQHLSTPSPENER